MDQVIKKQKMSVELKSLEDLPEEIILKILGQVNIRDLFQCSRVNKKIREIAHDKSLWEKLNLQSNVDVPADLFAKLLEKGCEYLSIIHFLTVKGTARFQNNLKLKYLSFKVSKSAKGVLEFAASCHQLEKLSAICEDDIDQSALDKVSKCIIQNSATLKVLCIENSQPMNYDSIRLIFALCQGLTDLSVAGIQMSQKSMNFLCANLTTGIEKLDISQQPTFGDDQLKKIVTRSTRLTELSFFDTNVSDDSVDLIIQNLHQTLTKLEISYSNFSFRNLLKIASMPNLKVLNVESLPTKKKEELLKTLPNLSLSNSFDRKKGCIGSRNEPCFCWSLCIAFPYHSCDHQLNGFWDIKTKFCYY